MIAIFDRIENIVGTGENAGYDHFLVFPVFTSLYQMTKFYTNPIWKHLQYLFWEGLITLLEKEKMLDTSIFSFCQKAFKWFLMQGH